MESNKLAPLDRNIPLRAIPPEELNRILLTDFLTWLCSLLSLTDETSAERLEMALPAIKDACISMGFKEIKKMFEMYADSKLNVKPIPNYFDRILLGKIVDDYRRTKPKPKPKPEPTITDEEKEFLMLEACDRVYKEYEHNGKLTSTCAHVYDYLFEKGLLPTDIDYKKQIYERAKLFAIAQVTEEMRNQNVPSKQIIKQVNLINDNKEKTRAILISKRLVLEDYLSELIKQGKKIPL